MRLHFYKCLYCCCTDGGKIEKPLSRRQKQRALKRAKKHADLAEKRKLARKSVKQQSVIKEPGKKFFCDL